MRRAAHTLARTARASERLGRLAAATAWAPLGWALERIFTPRIPASLESPAPGGRLARLARFVRGSPWRMLTLGAFAVPMLLSQYHARQYARQGREKLQRAFPQRGSQYSRMSDLEVARELEAVREAMVRAVRRRMH